MLMNPQLVIGVHQKNLPNRSLLPTDADDLVAESLRRSLTARFDRALFLQLESRRRLLGRIFKRHVKHALQKSGVRIKTYPDLTYSENLLDSCVTRMNFKMDPLVPAQSKKDATSPQEIADEITGFLGDVYAWRVSFFSGAPPF